MHKPFKTLVFLTTILSIFFVISILPFNKIKVNNIFEIKIPKFSFYINQPKPNIKAVNIIKNIENINKPSINIDTLEKKIKDTLYIINTPIEFAEGLENFFKALNNKTYIHVLHYGDSQIEGDRITQYLRTNFQSLFGGKGEGIILPFKINNIKQAVDVENKGNWIKYNIWKEKNKNNKNLYGPLLQYVRYAPDFDDSFPNDSIIYEATITLNKNTNIIANQLHIIYGNLKKPVLVQYYIDNEFVTMNTLKATQVTTISSLKINKPAKQIVIEFTGKDSPDIYAINLDAEKGIYFDNIPIRGNSGTDFTKISFSQLSSLFKTLNVSLIIWQFGINVVPSNINDYTFYENLVYNQLEFLKKCAPESSILVIGVSDMTMNTDSGMYSYPSVEKIRNAQRNAARKAGCAFWDTYEAMGGYNSMKEWVKAGLANTDYTHFTYTGAQHIAKLLFKAIYNEYINYNKKIKSIELTQK
jgi:lysophospholipase L1-like esterase